MWHHKAHESYGEIEVDLLRLKFASYLFDFEMKLNNEHSS